MREINTPDNNKIYAFESSKEVTDFTDQSYRFKERAEFYGRDLKSLTEAKKASEDKWDEGIEVLNAFTERLAKVEIVTLKSKKRTTTYSDSDGDEIDIERMMAGLPYWKTTKREDTQGPGEITIVIDTTTPSYVDPSDILWRGAAALALTKILEEKGYVVELWVVNGSKLFANENTNVMTACCLKRTSDPLDMSTMVNTVSGWFYRTLTFALLTTICKHAGKSMAYGFGNCFEPRPSDLREITPDENVIYASGVFSFSAAASLMEGELARISAHAEAK